MAKQIYRLSEARELRGFSVVELAEKIGVNRQAIYKYESGTQRPSAEVMDKIVDVLQFPLSFFMRPHIGMQFDERPIFFRDLKSNLEKYRRMAKRWLHLLVDHVAEYEKYLDLPEVNLPHFDLGDYHDLKKEEIDLLAERARRYWSLGDGPISDITLLCENNGIIIAHKNIDASKMDAFSFIHNGRPYIIVNTNKQTCSRVIMNLAHELGHLIMHQSIEAGELSKHANLDLIEKQAWRFAASFLMPPAIFTNELGYPSLKQFILLKKRWRTSISAMIMHSSNLGVINEERKQYFFRELSRNKWKASEPLDDELPIEKSKLLYECEKAIINAGIVPKDELFQRSGLNEHDYIEMIAAPSDYFVPITKRPQLKLV